jgi:hypothetical protein
MAAVVILVGGEPRMIKSLIAAAAVAATLTAAVPAQQAEAKTHVDINLGFGFGAFNPGYDNGYDYGYGYEPVYHPYYGISCGQGANIARWAGFRNVHAYDCGGRLYGYTGWKYGRPYSIMIGVGGHIQVVRPL